VKVTSNCNALLSEVTSPALFLSEINLIRSERMQYLAAARLLYVNDARGMLLLQVVDEASTQVVALRHHFHRVAGTRHRQQHAVLRLRLSMHRQNNLVNTSLLTNHRRNLLWGMRGTGTSLFGLRVPYPPLFRTKL